MTCKCDSCIECNCNPEVCRCDCHKHRSDDDAGTSREENDD